MWRHVAMCACYFRRGNAESIKLDFNPASTYAVVRLTDMLRTQR